MPRGDPDARTGDRCYYCNEKVGKANLKKCSQCQYVKYCSRDCQKAAWPTHKLSCASGAATNATITELGQVKYNSAFNKWLNCWRETLFELGIAAMDLANHPPDRLATHVLFILLERNFPVPRERERYFRVTGAEVLSREERATAVRDFGASEEQIAEMNRDERGDHTIQIHLVAEEHTRQLWCSYRDLTRLRAADKTRSARLAATWEGAVIAKVAYGYPGIQDDVEFPEDA
ncbi:zinc finger MYND domain-containing protein [Phanerochaete sordida]|uniref:Zinc finger MYND domain-containing protein n=1 Tax=Phanerochaete sordida TaxID=48140 RepID=A0A9P3GAN3_9APHY|nr:zinc finger MYND domain-containing protein [Phanerochaete sordida]